MLCGRYKSITISFLIVGHTKFSPDWCFGLLKQRLRRCHVDCLDDIVRVVESSADVNSAQLVGTQTGEILVPMYDWATFFAPFFKPLHQIKKYHHFHFSSTCPGVGNSVIQSLTRSTSTLPLGHHLLQSYHQSLYH